LRKKPFQTTLRLIALLFIGAAVVILAYSLWSASRSTPVLAANATWGGVPVGGLSSAEAVERVKAAYSAPVELRYRGQIIQVSPMRLFSPGYCVWRGCHRGRIQLVAADLENNR